MIIIIIMIMMIIIIMIIIVINVSYNGHRFLKWGSVASALGGVVDNIGLVGPDLHLRFLQGIGVEFPVMPQDPIIMPGGGGAPRVVPPVQVGVRTGTIPPGTMGILSTMATTNIIVGVLGGEAASIMKGQRITCW